MLKYFKLACKVRIKLHMILFIKKKDIDDITIYQFNNYLFQSLLNLEI